MTNDVDAVAAEFEDLASWCEGSSALYERLCAIVADDEFLLSVAADHTPGQPAPQLLLAAIQAELFASDADDGGGSGGDGNQDGDVTTATGGDGNQDGDVTAATAALAAYYPSVVDDPRPPDDDLADAVRAFVRERESTIRELVGTRRVQTNSVRRCSALAPGFATIANRVEAPIAVLSVGASAGLNLNWDRYRYRYRREHPEAVDDDAPALAVGDPNSPVTIETSLRGPGTPPLPDALPAVADRVGVDVNPLDPTDGADARWLRALVWPEHHDRRRVLDDALEVAREHPPEVVEGDAVTDLHAVADRLPADRPLVVSHSLVLYQFDDDAREAFHDAVAALANERDAPTFHLAGERPDPDRENGIQLRLERVDGTDFDESTSEHLGTFEQHGAWVAWQESSDGEDAAGGASVVHDDT